MEANAWEYIKKYLHLKDSPTLASITSYNSGQKTLGHLSNFRQKVKNLQYMLPSLYEQRVFFFSCLFVPLFSPDNFETCDRSMNRRILISETVRNQHCNEGRGKAGIVPAVLTRNVVPVQY